MKKINSVCVYCGTGSEVDAAYKQAAAEVGRLLADDKIRLVYGGGSVGLMGIVSDACVTAGGHVTGIIPGHISAKEIQNHGIQELIVVDSMHERKSIMVERSDAFIVLPGGMGTLDETFEILTWKYLRLHDKPVVFLNIKNYFDPLLAMIDHMVQQGFTPYWHTTLYEVATRPADVLSILQKHPETIKADIARL